MKRCMTILCVLAVLVVAVSGCEPKLATPTKSGAEALGDTAFYDESTGSVLTDLSSRFDFKIEQWELSTDASGQERLLFGVTIKNKTKTRLNNFDCDILFDEQLLYLFTTGLTTYDQNQPVDLIPEVTANGAGYSFDLSVNTEEQAAELGADKSELLKKAGFITLKMNWDGGEETVTLDCGKLNKAQSYENLLRTEDVVDIVVGPAEGSAGIRTMTLHYLNQGVAKSDILKDICFIDCSEYNDDNGREQTLSASDSDGDGIVDFIVYREFWFPDLKLIHPEVPLWPMVYEYDLNSGFMVVSAKHADIFKLYTKTLKKRLDSEKAEMTDNALLPVKRLIYAAEKIADGSFVPASAYEDKYYEDVYVLTKDIK